MLLMRVVMKMTVKLPRRGSSHKHRSTWLAPVKAD